VSTAVPVVVRPRAVWSWVLYDFANSPFTTLVITFVYGTFFTQQMVDDPIYGTALWSRAMTVTALIVAFCSPLLGALADRGGYRKRFVMLATLICVASTAALYRVLPGQVVTALTLVVIANVAYEFGTVFYNAFLPALGPPERMGRISGYGWGLGYAGGLAALVLALVSLVQPEVPWFGFTREQGEHIRATNLLVAAWFLLFSLPLFFFVHEDRSAVSPRGRVTRDAFLQLRRTFAQIRRYRQVLRFLLARLVYNDALVTIFAFGGIYAAETFGFTFVEVLTFGVVVNVTAGLGAIAMGSMHDKLGGKRTLILSLIGLIVATALSTVATSKAALWVAGSLLGIFVGPNQSSSRALMARFVPANASNEFFGFFAFSGKLTAFIGPLLLGILTQAAGSQRAGVAMLLVMFAIGLVLLLWVDEDEGIREAEAGRL
jgi:UMF1 family MFS transporter